MSAANAIADRYEVLLRAALERVRGRFLQPRRERVAEAVAALAELDVAETRAWIDGSDLETVVSALDLETRFDGPAAWERLVAAGVVSTAWAATSERCFLGASLETFVETSDEFAARSSAPTSAPHLVLWSGRVPGADVYEGQRRPLASAPDHVRGALAIAANPRGVATAEALAKEHAARLRACGFAVSDARALWRVLRPYPQLSEVETSALRKRPRRSTALGLPERTLPASKKRRAARDALELELYNALAPPEPWLESDRLRDWEDPQFSVALWNVRDACAWTALAEHGVVVDTHEALPAALTEGPLAAHQNPYEPLVGLLAEGFHLERTYDEGLALLALAV